MPVLVFSVDLELDARQQARVGYGNLEFIAGRLLDLCHRYQFPATWGVADPCHSAASDAICRSGLRHEIAILADHTWVGLGAGPDRQSRELARRCQGARAAGLQITSLLLRDTEYAGEVDLIVKHNLTALRVAAGARAGEAARPDFAQAGVLCATVHGSLPSPSRWWPGGSGQRRATNLISQAVRTQQNLHLVLDAPWLAETGGTGLGLVERLFQFAHEQRSQGCLSIETLQTLAASSARESLAVQRRAA